MKQRLRDWIVANGQVAGCDLQDDTPLLQDRLITSLQLVELILFVEALRGRPVDEAYLMPGFFRDIDTIARNFLEAS